MDRKPWRDPRVPRVRAILEGITERRVLPMQLADAMTTVPGWRVEKFAPGRYRVWRLRSRPRSLRHAYGPPDIADCRRDELEELCRREWIEDAQAWVSAEQERELRHGAPAPPPRAIGPWLAELAAIRKLRAHHFSINGRERESARLDLRTDTGGALGALAASLARLEEIKPAITLERAGRSSDFDPWRSDYPPLVVDPDDDPNI